MTNRYELVLFDLDGTLIDSAPDLGGTVNDMREQRGLAPLPLDDLRPMVGAGARGMVLLGLGVESTHESFAGLRTEFLDLYEKRLSRLTHVFPDVVPVLKTIEAANLHWGIVTNKMERLTAPVVRALGLDARAAAVVSGDTTPHSKPHPAPLLEAARRAGVEPTACVYVGDDHRDIVAGKAAGMATVAVRWGYLGQGEKIENWGADFVIDEPLELLKLLNLA
ncbi:MAG: phosphoglycolate phosphatase [Rhizobacter sp.]|nr:phosphoglycolate phosphatase [Rhizobacter sp.]